LNPLQLDLHRRYRRLLAVRPAAAVTRASDRASRSVHELFIAGGFRSHVIPIKLLPTWARASISFERGQHA